MASAVDENQGSPIGFEVIFPTMIERSKELGLNFFMEPSIFNVMVQKRETQLKRFTLFFIAVLIPSPITFSDSLVLE